MTAWFKKQWLAIPLLTFLVVALVIPMLVLLARGIDFAALNNPFILERLLSTLLQALLSSGIVLILALLCGGFLARYSFRGKALLESVLALPFVVPVLVAALGFLSLFGARGWIVNLEGTLWLVLLANVFYNLGIAIRLVMSSLSAQSLEPEMMARLEGASSMQVWRFVTLPTALPSATIGAGLAFLYTFASFGVPLLLGGSSFATLEVEMYQSVQRLELSSASALALLQVLVTFTAAWLVTSFEQRHSQAAELNSFRPRAKGWTRVALGAVVMFLLTLTFVPLVAVLIRSLSNSSGLTFVHYTSLFAVSSSIFSTDLGLAIWNNLRFAALTLLFAVPLGISYGLYLWRSQNGLLNAVSLLPLAVSSTMLGVAYIIAYPSLTASLLLLIAVYVLTAYPLVTRATLSALQNLEPSLLEAASLDGANQLEQFWFIVLPLTQQSLRGGIALGFAVVLGEFAATQMLSRPEWATLTTAIYQRLSKPNQLGEASALAMILLGVTLLGFWLIGSRTREPRRREQ